jgi:hypothetical protein
LIDAEIAALLVQRMAAEPIRQGVIRMFPHWSIFSALKVSSDARYIPEKLSSGNIGGVFRKPSKAEQECRSTVPRSRRLSRYREVFGDNQIVLSLGGTLR